MKHVTLPIRFGFLISLGLIVYFILLSLVDLHTNPMMSLFNAVITGLGIYMAIKTFKETQRQDFSYGAGFKVGITSGFLATIVFSIFFLLYATEINPAFLDQLLTVFRGDYQCSHWSCNLCCGYYGICKYGSFNLNLYATLQTELEYARKCVKHL